MGVDYDNMITILQNLLANHNADNTDDNIEIYFDDKGTQQEVARRVPKVLEAKKVTFLKAIDKSYLVNSNIELNAHDEEFVLKHLDPAPEILSIFNKTNKSLIFDDSIVLTKFKQIKKPEFDLRKYVTSVKWIYANYLELETDLPVLDFSLSDTFAYVLAFARDFNNPTKNLFEFSANGSNEISCTIIDDILSKEFPGNMPYIKNLNKLITELLECYSEKNYQILNLNVTYIILLMLRRVIKTDKEFATSLQNDETHSNYWELCPLRLDYRLPMITPQNNNYLNTKLSQRDDIAIIMILYAYTNCSGRTRRVFRATCIRHMEYNGLGLPSHYKKVAKLYNVCEGKLWDLLTSQTCCRGLMNLSDFCDSQAAGRNEQPPKTYNLFPYCRVLNSYYHSDLSANHHMNLKLSFVLAYLIDLKFGLDVSSARHARWTHSVPTMWKASIEEFAMKVSRALSLNNSTNNVKRI